MRGKPINDILKEIRVPAIPNGVSRDYLYTDRKAEKTYAVILIGNKIRIDELTPDRQNVAHRQEFAYGTAERAEIEYRKSIRQHYIEHMCGEAELVVPGWLVQRSLDEIQAEDEANLMAMGLEVDFEELDRSLEPQHMPAEAKCSLCGLKGEVARGAGLAYDADANDSVFDLSGYDARYVSYFACGECLTKRFGLREAWPVNPSLVVEEPI